MLDELEIYAGSTVFQDNYLIALKKHNLMSDRIYQVYAKFIHAISETA